MSKSENSLRAELGLKPGMSTYFSHAPAEYFNLIGHHTYTHRPDDDGTYEFMHAFFKSKTDLEASAWVLTSKLADDGVLWVSWPSIPSENENSLTEQIIRETLSRHGVVDTKSCRLDNYWSALKFVWRE